MKTIFLEELDRESHVQVWIKDEEPYYISPFGFSAWVTVDDETEARWRRAMKAIDEAVERWEYIEKEMIAAAMAVRGKS